MTAFFVFQAATRVLQSVQPILLKRVADAPSVAGLAKVSAWQHRRAFSFSGCLKACQRFAVQHRALQAGIGADVGHGNAAVLAVGDNCPCGAQGGRNAVFLQQLEHVFMPAPMRQGDAVVFAGASEAA